MMREKLRGSICGDGCGLGKTHEIIALVLAASVYWTLCGRPVDRLTLVVVPNALLAKRKSDFSDQLGGGWAVCVYGEKRQGSPVTFKKDHALYQPSSNSGKTVVVVSLEILSTKTPHADMDGLFLRIVIDESQGIPRCDQNKR
jgi:superfamily II DNA or RNA helicase